MQNEYLTPDWPAPDNVQAVVTTRSKAHFNLAQHVDDNPQHVAENRLQLKKELDLPTEPHWLTQVHGNAVVKLPCSETTADASVTDQAGNVCVVLTADCLPVLFCNSSGTKVAAAHAGWRGLYQKILTKTVATFNEPNEQLLAYFGPAISQTHYEVGESLRTQFLELNPEFESAFKQYQKNWHCDLYALARIELQQLGLTKIYGGQHCTFAEKDLFFSYRRDGAKTGRIASLVWLNKTS